MTFVLDHDARDCMREMTAPELDAWYRLHRWPCCGAPTSEHWRGPSAGASVNVACPHCDMRVNVMDPTSPYAAIAFGQVIREPRRTVQ